MVLLASGCSESQRKTVDLAISAHPETKVQGQYEDVIVELTTARDIIQLRAPDMPLDDRVALQVAYVETIRTQAVFEQALSQPGGLDADALKNAIAMGLMAYERGSPVLLRNRELFTPEEWRLLSEANVSLRKLSEGAYQLRDAGKLKEAAVWVSRALKLAAAVAF